VYSSSIVAVPHFLSSFASHPEFDNRLSPLLLGIIMRAALFLLALFGAVDATSGTFEIDLVFPRNETYAPRPNFPVIVGFENSELAPNLNPSISLEIDDLNAPNKSSVSVIYHLESTNWTSSDPYYELKVFRALLQEEGSWNVFWTVSWTSCTEDSDPNIPGTMLLHNQARRNVIFTTKNSAQEVDLLAATTDRNCSENGGVAINIATTLPVPEGVSWDQGSTCASVASTTPALTPCRVKFNSDAALSMSSVVSSIVCRQTSDIGAPCSPEDEAKNDAQRLVSGAVAGLTAAFGVLGYVML
jgi:hypothetical protein